MKALIYNIGVSVGLLLIGAGAWLLFGLGVALLVVGSLMWATTIISTYFAVLPPKVES